MTEKYLHKGKKLLIRTNSTRSSQDAIRNKNRSVIVNCIGAVLLGAGGIVGLADYFYRMAFARTLPAGSGMVLGIPGKPGKRNPDEKAWDALKKLQESWLETVKKKTIHIVSEDGLRLYGTLLMPAKKTAKTVILVHGFHGGAADFPGLDRFFLEHGFNVLYVENRAHGRSEGRYLGFGYKDRRDLVSWSKKIVRLTGEDAEIVLLGISMGGAAVMSASGEADLPVQVKAIIEDCGFASTLGEFYSVFPKVLLPIRTPVIMTASLISKLKEGYFFSEANEKQAVSQNTRPMLFIHGGNDTFVPTRMVYEVYECCSAYKEIYICPGALHAGSYSHAPETYEACVERFLINCGII